MSCVFIIGNLPTQLTIAVRTYVWQHHLMLHFVLSVIHMIHFPLFRVALLVNRRLLPLMMFDLMVLVHLVLLINMLVLQVLFR